MKKILFKTNCEGQKDLQILKSIRGQLSDGIFESELIDSKLWEIGFLIGEDEKIWICSEYKDFDSFEAFNNFIDFYDKKMMEIIKTEENDGFEREKNNPYTYLGGDKGLEIYPKDVKSFHFRFCSSKK